MSRIVPHFYFSFVFFLLSATASAQTVLYPGDIAILGVATDMGGCGFPAESDEFSFVCFRDITSGTSIDFTDNGWETASAGLWGDGEGTLNLTRTGGTIAAGTVITIRAVNNAGNWTYTVAGFSPGWALGQINNPGGIFNLEPGGDQIYIMQGGTWDNQGAGGDDATYDGEILFGFNTVPSWNANGSSNQSNLHPDVDPCFHMESPSSDFYKYTSPLTTANQLDWMKRITDGASWNAYGDCASYVAAAPVYATGYTIPIGALTLSVYCPTICEGCAPYVFPMVFGLPTPGFFDVTYTDGTDTFELFGIENFHFQFETLSMTTTFELISVTEVGGCPIPPHFTGSATYTVPYVYPGSYTAIYVCEDYTLPLPLNHWLMGAAGGKWSPILAFDQFYYTAFGEGKWTYTQKYMDPDCPPDTASIDVIFPHANGTIIEVSCDQNGTPNNIFDDFTVITMTVNGNNFGTEYAVTVSSGTISPTMGLVGVPTVFTFPPGSAMGPDLTISIQNLEPPEEHISIGTCFFDFLIMSPGFCSDPCDYTMEATISGDSEICINVCPDEPVYAEIEVIGGTPPYTMDFSVTATSFPTWTFTDVPVQEFSEIVICIDTIAAPAFNPQTYQLTLPAAFAGQYATIDLVNVYDKYSCTALLDGSASVTVYPLPQLDTFNFSICSEFATTADLTQYAEEINLFYDVVWYDGNPLTVGEQIPNPNVVNLNNIVQLWALVEDDYCRNSIQVPFTILPSPRIDTIPPVEICDGSIVVLDNIQITDLGNSMATYTFHTTVPLDTSTLLDTLYYLPVDSVTILLLATAATCYDTMPIDINLQPYPDFMLAATPCNIALNTYSVLFTSSADSIYASAGIVTNNVSGQDMVSGIPGGTNVTIEILNASGMCRDTFMIVAPNCNCPTINPPVPAQAAYEICDYSAIPVFSVTIDPGLIANWYDVPSGGVPLLQNSLTFQPASLASATYYAEALNLADNCPSLRTPITFNVNPSAILQPVTDPVLCTPGTINIDALVPGVVNGVSGTGSWFNLSTNLPVSGTIQPAQGDSWYYQFSSNPGMCISRDTITATVHPLPVLNVFEIVCDDLTLSYTISFTSNAEQVQVSIGNLTNIPSTDTFTVSSVGFGTDIQINLDNPSTGCSTTINQTAPNCACPALLQQPDDEVCSDNANLDLSVYEGVGVSGTWQMVSTPAGGNPATLAGSNFQGMNGDPGLYVLRFIRSVIIADCVDSALFQINLHTSPFADAGVDGTACAPDNIILAGTASGSNVQYSWQTNGAGSITNPNALNTSYTPVLADFTSGTVSFTLTATDQTGFCPQDQETIDIDIDATAYFILDPGTQTYCDTSDILVDLDAFIDYGPTSGTWFFPAGVTAPITNNSQFNPSTLVAGNYTVYYTTNNAVAPCENDTAGISLIIENCLCPSVALNTPTNNLCSQSGTVNLNTFLITTEAGTWSISNAPPGNNPAVINGTNFVTNQSDAGTYTVRFTLAQPVAGCPAFAEITYEVIQSPSIQLDNAICAGDLLTWEATVISSAEVVTNANGVLTALGGNRYRITNLVPGVGTQVTASNGNGLCVTQLNIPAPDCDCEIAIGTLPDDVSLCPGESMTYTASVTGGKGQVTSFWIVANDSLYQSTIVVDQSGTYTFVSIDSLGCRDEHIINSTIYTEMVADIDMTAITCPGDNDGTITIFSIQGGNGPFGISLNNGAVQPISTFPYIISNLGQGNYSIEIVDAFNCSINENAIISSASSETLTLGPDETILVGDSILIQAILSFTPDTFTWSGDIAEIKTDQLSSWASPEEDMSLTLVAVDDKGCVYTDDIKIKVLLTSSVIVPNIFSPNDDGINDLLIPSMDPSIVSVEYFEIFSRWGELVYSKTNFLPQDNVAWDGKLKGKEMNPGVFLYRILATNKKGQEIALYGDLTLVR